LVVWNREGNVFEVVDSRATDEYGIFQGILGKRGDPLAILIIPDWSSEARSTAAHC
jgi:hypothetical protein